jgi:hypothetical protein
MDVSWGHEPDWFGVPASAGRASIARGAGKVSSAGFSLPTPTTFNRFPAEAGTPNGTGSWNDFNQDQEPPHKLRKNLANASADVHHHGTKRSTRRSSKD